MNFKLAPICLFTYNRYHETIKTVEALQRNYLAKDSELYVFSDGPKNESTKTQVEEVRAYLSEIRGFKSIKIYESSENKGLANSIIQGVSKVLKDHGSVIVLEDDLITSPNFLDFMNQALTFYTNKDKVFSISGYTMNLKALKDETRDFYLGYRASSWGWATWENRWNEIDWDVDDYKEFKWNILRQIDFMRGGSDMPRMLWRQMNNQIDSWAIRWCYHQFKNDLLTVFPVKSKVQNIGFGEMATHTKKQKNIFTYLDTGVQIDFEFNSSMEFNKTLLQEFRSQFSVIKRIKNRLL
ncbi:glycosyltransferase [Leeuwenhoekiella aequorea]|uniref:glycosyltransferase n=1 Tax=Leeuwenhoekiella aequorea TaxID=283736 RepID=UPI00352EFD3F|tara:strand:- start:2794 stop:3681 length:888 start_codon:yes stop_codon:yes gene_type:complete